MNAQSYNGISLRDVMLALAVTALWGLHFTVIKIGAHEIPSLFLLVVRFSIACLIFLPFIKRIDAAHWRDIASYTIPYLVIHLGTLFVALNYTDAGLSSIILQLGLPFSIILGWIFFKERFGLKTLIGLILSFVGVIILVYQPLNPHFSILGAALLVLSSVGWAVGALRMRSIQDVDFINMTFYSHIIALPFAILGTLIFETGQIEHLQNANMLNLSFVLFYQVIVMSACLFLWKGLMHRNPVFIITPFTMLVPVFGVICGMVFLAETLDSKTVIGGFITLLGVLIITVRKIQKAERIEYPDGD